MTHRRCRRWSIPFPVVVLLLGLHHPSGVLAQERATLTPEDYGKWESLGSISLDPRGEWVAVTIRRVDESEEIRLRRADASVEEVVLEHATGPVFSPDGRWLAWRQGVSPDARESADGPVRNRLGLRDLESGRDTILVEMRSFAFRDDGDWLAVLGHPVADSVGADLLVMRPGGGPPTLLGNVDEFAWQDGGTLLAVTLKTAWRDANGVTLVDPEAGVVRSLDSRNADYRELTWREDSGTLAVLRSVESEARTEESHDVLVWGDVNDPAALATLDGSGGSELGDTLRITEYAGITFSDDGGTVFVGVRPWEEVPADDESGPSEESVPSPEEETAAEDSPDDPDPAESADVQIWHWNDDLIIRAQEWRASQIARQTLTAAWHLGADRVLVMGRELQEPASLTDNGAWALVPDFTPYLFQRRFGSGAADWYRVDPADEEWTLLSQGLESSPSASPDGRTALLFEGDHWVAVDLASLERTRIDPQGEVDFLRSLEDYDYPGPRPSWGVAGWSTDGDAAYLNDRLDVWRVDLSSGDVTRITPGAEDGRRYRMLNLDPDAGFFDQPEVEAGEAVWFSVFDPATKASGYARGRPGEVEILRLEDAIVTGLTKARDADRYALRMERWDDSPDVFVSDGADLEDLTQVFETNPFQAEYAWGRTELVSYTTDAGHDLQAILAYPANFEEGRQYPLILYQYERLSDGLHRYRVPSERSYYDYQTWSQQGYFVLMPDIVYEPGRPGPSALDAVEHALDAAVATGHVDPQRMGLIGHSWGGYQAAYLPTRTHRFAASVAGAAITDFISFMGAVHWNGGLPETGHWETGQARMARPPWEDLTGHLESSPVNFIHELETPVLLMHGDSDGVVDFRQGLEYYNYARRAGKPVILLVYPGADHGLREESQQVDYHRRILEWFGHWLKGEPAPEWITEGETWVEREKRMGG